MHTILVGQTTKQAEVKPLPCTVWDYKTVKHSCCTEYRLVKPLRVRDYKKITQCMLQRVSAGEATQSLAGNATFPHSGTPKLLYITPRTPQQHVLPDTLFLTRVVR